MKYGEITLKWIKAKEWIKAKDWLEPEYWEGPGKSHLCVPGVRDFFGEGIEEGRDIRVRAFNRPAKNRTQIKIKEMLSDMEWCVLVGEKYKSPSELYVEEMDALNIIPEKGAHFWIEVTQPVKKRKKK